MTQPNSIPQIRLIRIDSIHTGNNDRTIFDPNELRTLADSIHQNGKGQEGKGLIQPLTVTLFAPDPRCAFGGDQYGDAAQYTLVAGERRLRACQSLGWKVIPAIVADLTPAEASAIMLSENVSRKDLDPIDEARAYRIRMEKFRWTEEDCAKAAGTTIIRVRFRLKLLRLREDFHVLIRSGQFPIGYAQILADAGLDTNRQLLAFNQYRENPRPTTGWFRNIVNQYAEQQNQQGLFDTSNFLQAQTIPNPTETAEPPHPSTTTPPIIGRNPSRIIQEQIKFWTEAAEQWRTIGKPFKSQECQAAALALAYVAKSI